LRRLPLLLPSSLWKLVSSIAAPFSGRDDSKC
jgi:hypothetical protein